MSDIGIFTRKRVILPADPFVAAPVSAAGPAYAGPGDVVASAEAWWGLRGYTAAYATGSNPALDLHNDTTGTFVGTVNILATGALDVATASTLISGGASKIGKLYDQTGNGHHLSRATNSERPTLTLSAIGSLPGMTFVKASSQQLQGTAFGSSPGNVTLSGIAKLTGTGQSGIVATNTGASPLLYFPDNDTVSIYSGGVSVAVSATDGSFYTGIGVFDTGSSDTLYVNGSSNAGDCGTGTFANEIILGNDTFNDFLQGLILEAGIWFAQFNATQAGNMNTQQRSYWGF